MNLVDKIIHKLIPLKYKLQIRNDAFKGNNNYCPCCNSSLIAFFPFGLNIRLNAFCPICGSVERHRLLIKYLTDKTNLFHLKGKMLHVSPEECLLKIFKKLGGLEYISIDKFEDRYFYPHGTINMDITQMQFESNSFDVIICNHVLEHIDDDTLAMKEIYRVLKPDGFAILQVPLDKNREKTYEDPNITKPEEREKAFGQFDHVRVYGLDYKDRLKKVGFTVEVTQFTSQFSDNEIFKYGFMKGEDIYYCTK